MTATWLRASWSLLVEVAMAASVEAACFPKEAAGIVTTRKGAAEVQHLIFRAVTGQTIRVALFHRLFGDVSAAAMFCADLEAHDGRASDAVRRLSSGGQSAVLRRKENG